MVEGNFQIYRFQITGNIAIFAFASPRQMFPPGYLQVTLVPPRYTDFLVRMLNIKISTQIDM